MSRVETQLFNFCEVVSRIFVQDEFANRDERELVVRPHFGNIQRVEITRSSFLAGHYLDIEGPRGKVSCGDGVVKIAKVVIGIFACDAFGFCRVHVANTLVGLVMEFAVTGLFVFVNEGEGIGTEAVHVTETGRNTFGTMYNHTIKIH